MRKMASKGKLFPPEVDEWLRRWRRLAPSPETIRFSGWTSPVQGFCDSFGSSVLQNSIGLQLFPGHPIWKADVSSNEASRPSLPKSLLPPRLGKSLFQPMHLLIRELRKTPFISFIFGLPTGWREPNPRYRDLRR